MSRIDDIPVRVGADVVMTAPGAGIAIVRCQTTCGVYVRMNDEGRRALQGRRPSRLEPAPPPLAVGSNGGRAISADRLQAGRLVSGTSVRWAGQPSVYKYDQSERPARATSGRRIA